MKKAFALLFCASIFCFGAEKTLEDLEAENKALEAQIKNEKLKKELEESKKSDEEKKLEAVAQAKEILKDVFKEPSKDEKRSGKLWGFGIGGTAMTFQSPGGRGAIVDCSTTSLMIDGQAGGITMWNRYFGIQYYANIDAGFIFDDSNSGWTAITSTYTFNADAILNAYNSDSFGVGFLVGLGIGAKYDYVAYSHLSRGNFGFDARFNLGLRLIFGSHYALDFMARFPFLDHETGLTYFGKPLKYRENASFSARFTMGRF